MKILIFYFLIFLFSINAGFSQNRHSIDFNISNYENDTLLLAYFYGEKQMILDTVFAAKKGTFEYRADSILNPGVYIGLIYPSKEYFQFLVNETELNFSVDVDYNKLSDISSNGSKDNELFFDYIKFIGDMNTKAKTLSEEKSKLVEAGLKTDDVDAKLEKLDKDVKSMQWEMIKNNPNTIFALLIKANMEIEIPDFDVPEDELSLKRFHYYKDHFFDYIDFHNPATIFTPFIHNKVTTYMERLTLQMPDSIISSIDYVLGKMDPKSEIWKYYVSNFLNTYARSQFVGMDAVYVHLAKKYYATGMTPWVETDRLNRIIDTALKLENVLIGKIAPNIVLYDEAEKPVAIHDIVADYTVLVFWKPDCGHCKTSMPAIVDFQKDFRDKNVKVVGICTKMGSKFDECWEVVQKLKMESFSMNLADGRNRSNFHAMYNIQSTPQIFVLDKNKKILIKQIPGEKLGEIVGNIIENESGD
jgi:thiol-disulfide isomerase/thioredoxin